MLCSTCAALCRHQPRKHVTDRERHRTAMLLQGFMHFVSAGPSRVDVEALNDHMRPAGALRLRHAQVWYIICRMSHMTCGTGSHCWGYTSSSNRSRSSSSKAQIRHHYRSKGDRVGAVSICLGHSRQWFSRDQQQVTASAGPAALVQHSRPVPQQNNSCQVPRMTQSAQNGSQLTRQQWSLVGASNLMS
jgi:hypothetical protein